MGRVQVLFGWIIFIALGQKKTLVHVLMLTLRLFPLTATILTMPELFANVSCAIKYICLYTAICIVSIANTTQAPIQVRLINGGEHSGTVEILYAGLWGTICYYFSFDLASANVICRQLGYPGASRVSQFFEFNDGTGQIWLTSLSCTGSESSVDQCSHSGFGIDISTCYSFGDIGVECVGMFVDCLYHAV